jgi:pimeloyl-ACP methyl ester carboxylesterase
MEARVIEERDVALLHGITLRCRGNGLHLLPGGGQGVRGDEGHGGAAAAGASPPGAARPPRVLLLHGFPEAAFIWDEVIERLGPEVACIAPNLRGYAGSSAPVDENAYRAKPLVADLVALVGQIAPTVRAGAPLDLLVAHDWGGALAWAFAAQHPALLRRLLIVNAPHPAAFVRALRSDPAQQAASAYMHFLLRPDAPARLAADSFALLWRFLDSPWWRIEDAQRRAYEAVWRQGLAGPLNWYRASRLRPPSPGGDTPAALQLPDEAVRVGVPTHVLWGDADRALRPGLLDGLSRWVPSLTVQRVPDASHWIVHERPALAVDAIRAQLARPAP